MSAATWQQLVESKVPYRLASACCRVLQHCSPAPPSSSPPAQQQQQQTATQQAFAAAAYNFVLEVLHVFVGRANSDGQLTARECEKSRAGLWQQLQQSGLLQLLPSLLSQVAAELQAAARVPPVFSDILADCAVGKLSSFAGLDFASATGGAGVASVPGSSTNSTSAGQQRDSDCGSSGSSSTDTLSVVQAAAAVFNTCAFLAQCDSADIGAAEGVADWVPAALRAVPAVLPFISHCMQHASVQHSFGLQELLVRLWSSTELLAGVTIILLAGASNTAGQEQDAARVLEAAYDVLPCTAAVSCTLFYRQLLLQLPALPGADAAAASGSSSGSGRDGRSPNTSSSISCIARLLPHPYSPSYYLAQTWQLASQQSSNMPETHVQLAQLLGCDTRVLLWLAASCGVLDAFTHSDDGSQCAEALANANLLFVRALNAYQQLAQADACRQRAPSSALEQLQPDEQRRLLQLHYLLPSVLLYYAAHQPANSSLGAAQAAEGRLLACQFSAQANNALHRMIDQLAHSQPAGSAQRQPLVSAAAHQAMLRELFLLGSRIAAVLLPQLGCAVGAAAGSSRSSSGSITSTAADSVPPSTAELKITTATAMCVLVLLGNIARTAAHLELTGVECDEQAAVEAAAGIGLQHALWLTRLLEATVRRRSEAGDTLSALGSACWQLLGDGGFLHCAAEAAGPDSPQQAQLISLCCSVLKALTCSSPGPVTDPNLCRAAVMRCADERLEAIMQASSGLQHSMGTTLAWLAVLGRFLCAAQLAAAQAAPTGPLSQNDHNLFSVLELCAGVVEDVQDWLQQDDVAAQLSAAGFDAAGLLQCALDCPADQMGTLEGFQAAQQQVQSLAAALTSLPLPQACNNTSCSNLCGPRELQLVNGRSCICGGCKQARYCSRACQVLSWVQHRPVCKAIQAAASATATAAAAAASASTAAAEAQA